MAKIPTGKKIYLCTPSLTPIAVLNGVDTESASYGEHIRDYSSLTFDVYENIVVDGRQVRSNGYDLLDVYMYLYLEDIAYFQMQYPQVRNDGTKEYKSITAYSIDKEWEDKDWVDFKVNTGEEDSLEMLVKNNKDDLGFVINYIDFFNPDRRDLSLLHIILEKMPNWSVDEDDIDKVLWHLKRSFSEDSINLYALMTSVIAPQYECIFEFDCLNRKIKAHHKDNLDFDTNIFIGFRNLASQIEQSVDEDSVFTRFNVEGGNELSIMDWNYNNSHIFNIDYFMHEPYMSQEQIYKFQTWIKWQDEHREEFANLSQNVSDLKSKIYDLKYRVPDDGCDTKQWAKMDEEGLEESLKYYNSLIDAFEVSVDVNPTYTGSDGRIYHRNDNGQIVDENNVIIQDGISLSYNPWTITESGETHVDYDRYLSLLQEMENGKAGYYTYYEIVTYIIPNIEIALWNLKHAPTTDSEKDFNDDWETDWELYGYEELNGILEDYQNRIELIKNYSKDPYYHYDIGELESGIDYIKDSIKVLSLDITTKPKEGDTSSITEYTMSDILKIKGIKSIGIRYDKNEKVYISITATIDNLFAKETITKMEWSYQYRETSNPDVIKTSGNSVHDEAITLIPKKLYYYDIAEILEDKEYVKDSIEIVSLDITVEAKEGGASDSITYNKSDILNMEDVDSIEVRFDEEGTPYISIYAFTNRLLNGQTISEINWQIKYLETEESEQPIYITSTIPKISLKWEAKTHSPSDGSYVSVYEEYWEKLPHLGDEETENSIKWWLKQLKEQIDEIGSEIQGYNLSRMQMVAKVNVYATEITESDTEEYSYDIKELDELNSEWGFTFDDIKLFHTLMHDTDYVNENILTTSLNTTSTLTSVETIIQKEKELLDDSIEKLSEISQPQITFTVDMDNIMNIPEFNELKDDCRMLRFIRLGVRDDYSVKLRIVGRSWNPCEVTDNFTLEFSNMVTSKSGRSDLTDLLNNGGGGASKNSITIGSGNSDSDKEYASNLLSLMISTGLFSSAVSNVGGVGVDEAQVNNLISEYLSTNLINEASFNKIFSRYIDVSKLVADTIDTDTLVANIITGRDGDEGYYMNLITGHLNMNTITADSAFINSVSSLISESMTSVTFDQYVYNAVANKISVGDLTAGDIVLTNNMRILSDNGMMIMNGTALQIYGEDSNGDPYVGIQLGYDTSSNPSLILRNEEGATILTPSGITSDAIADGLIINDMIHDNTISKGKLGFDIIEANEYGGVDITQIYDGSGNLWGVQYTSFKNSTESSLQEIENTKMYRVVVESDNGNIFKNGDVNCTLTCRVYSWDEEITDDINATYFTWTRKSKNSNDDAQWNANHSGGRKSIALTSSDVYGRSVFYCTVTLPDGTVQSSG